MTLRIPAPATQEEGVKELFDEKLQHPDRVLAKKLRHVIQKHPEVIASAFEHVRRSTVSVKHSFELKSNNPIFQEARRMSPMHSEIVRKEVDRRIPAGISTLVEPA